jgi:hypothetical protein
MHGEPRETHEWLQRLVGDWTYQMEAAGAPGEPPVKLAGSERVRLLGGTWALCEGGGEMPEGGTGDMLMTLGYDPATQRFKGTFVGSMMTHIWIYDGELDASGNRLTLDTEGPSWEDGGTMTKYRDTIEMVAPDQRVLTSDVLGSDGRWTRFMTTHYRRAA